jgi:hypothetical protein
VFGFEVQDYVAYRRTAPLQRAFDVVSALFVLFNDVVAVFGILFESDSTHETNVLALTLVARRKG